MSNRKDPGLQKPDIYIFTHMCIGLKDFYRYISCRRRMTKKRHGEIW